MKPTQKNAADEDQVKLAGDREKLGRDRDLEDLRFVLSSRQGRRFYWRYMAVCGVFTQSFTGNSETFFKEGKRAIGLRLLEDLNDAAPEAYVLMLGESKDE